MTAPLFYTIATHRADGLPLLLEVHRQGGETYHGRCDGIVVNIRRGACSGRFNTPAQARRALQIAQRVCENHRYAITTAKMALDDANLARKRDLRKRLAKLAPPPAPTGGQADA